MPDRGARVIARAMRFFTGLACGLFASLLAHAQVNVTTARNDIGRTGQNLSETILTPSNVNATQFGKLFAQAVDGEIYAQPLYMSGLTVNGVQHNVVFVATEHDSVYAFDADNTSGTNTSPLWQASMLTAAHGAAAGATTEPWNVNSDVYPEIGIEGTPVIDPISLTIYLVSKTVEGGSAVERLHALDVTTGAEKFGGPMTISASVPGNGSGGAGTTVPFLPHYANQRPGLLLLNGVVYIGFASHQDVTPWHGWVLAYNATTLQQTGVFCSTPNDNGGGIWMSGTGLAADQLDPAGHPYGRMFAPTGNGGYDASQPYTSNMDLGDSILDLDLSNGTPTVVDAFTPSAQANYEANDIDVASGGLMVLPTQTTGSHPNLLVQTGKSGTLYLLNRDNLGGYHATDQVVQSSAAAVSPLWSSPGYWNGKVYYAGQNDYLKSFALVNGLLSLSSPITSQETFNWPGATPAISANGNTQGIAWTIDAGAYTNHGPSILRAHDASNVAVTLYSTTTNPGRDAPGPAVKFTVPTIANGKVYVGTGNQLDVYGLLSGATQTSVPSFSPASGTYTGPQNVTITDATTNSTIYYTTDGSPATISSNVYTGPISVAASKTINAIATSAGLLASSQASAIYTITLPQAATPAFSPAAGSYGSTQSVVLSDTTPGATIYYTTNGSTPTTASTVYSTPISVSATQTIKAIATASGYAASAVASATYTITTTQPTAATPTFSPVAGAYTTSQSVTLSDTTPGATIYYTTDGSTPTTASVVYSSPITVSTSETLKAIAAASGYSTSAVGTALYTIGSSSTPVVNYPSGFTASGLTLNNGAAVSGGALVVTDGGLVESRSAWYSTPVNVQTFTTDFTFQLTAATADGFTFAIQNVGLSALGDGGSSLGYGGIGSSVAVKFDLFNSTGEGPDSTGFYTNGASPTQPASDMTASGVNLHSGDTMSAHLVYDGTTLTLTITDQVTSASFTTSTAINIPATVGGNTAYVGFTGGTGGSSATQKILTWTFSNSASSGPAPAATPTFTPAAGSYTAAQSVALSDTTPAATIYYTTDGSTPTTASTVYSAPISVGATQTIKAIATASGFTTSAVGSATYTITITQPTAATPTFTPAAGSYTAAQSVTLSDTTTGATIYYTTDGSTPTTASTVYSAPISVSATQTIKAIAAASGYTTSAVGSATYTITITQPTAATPTFTPAAGSYTAAQSVTLSDTTTGATIYYTTNGSTPTTASTVYSAPISVSATQTIKAIATASGYTTSAVGSAAYTITLPAAATPTFTPAAGTYSATQSVTLSDTTPGATIYYTTNGSTPTTASTIYNGPISVSATQTIKAIATASGYTTSAVGSAAYTISLPAAATPTFSPAAGTYSAAQIVTLSDAISGATIYYTTNGSTPTTASTVYSAPIPVNATQTIKAIATASGYTTSAVGTAAYTISNGTTPAVNYPSGFTASGLNFNNGASVSGAALVVTDGGVVERRSAWYSTPVNVQKFTTDFTFQLTAASADGFTFAIQNVGLSALGDSGSSLGYGGIGSSVAVKFDLFNSTGEGPDSTGFYTNGASPTQPASDMTASGVNLHSGDTMSAHLVYDGTTLTLTITDQVTSASFTTSTAINIPATVGGNTAYVGFTGGTGGYAATQKILTWTYLVN
jgi:Chitobiase/beta-hexosaminidase C-terminal domain/Legume lectin domain